jgi:hypothetical protein
MLLTENEKLTMTASTATSTGKRQQQHEQLPSKDNRKKQINMVDDNSSKDCDVCVVYNFRLAAGLKGIYRCGTTDGLASVVVDGSRNDDEKGGGSQPEQQSLLVLLEPVRILLQEATLVLDLRDVVERDEAATKRWTSQAPGGPLSIGTSLDVTAKRQVLMINMMGVAKIFEYIDRVWLSGKIQDDMDATTKQLLRFQAFNDRGLAGMNEIILGQQSDLVTALQAITIHREVNPIGIIVAHCSQGKDRTAIIVMLCQAVAGLSDPELVHEYALSEGKQLCNPMVTKKFPKGLDRHIFTTAPPSAMQATLQQLKKKYGSIHKYLDEIGFDESWQQRLKAGLSSSSC